MCPRRGRASRSAVRKIPRDTRRHGGDPPPHRDLCDMLCTHSISAGTQISFDCAVAGVSPPSAHTAHSGSRPSVSLRSGEIVHADLIVGADGARGIARRVVDAQISDLPGTGAYTGTTVYTGVCAADNADSEQYAHGAAERADSEPSKQGADFWLSGGCMRCLGGSSHACSCDCSCVDVRSPACCAVSIAIHGHCAFS